MTDVTQASLTSDGDGTSYYDKCIYEVVDFLDRKILNLIVDEVELTLAMCTD